jgi:hypothetical protein
MIAQTFEQRLESVIGTDGMDAFWKDCRSLFRTGTGQRVIAALIKARHPMTFPRAATDSETFAMNGQREVVAALARSLESPHE